MTIWTKFYCRVCKKIVSHRTKGEVEVYQALTNKNVEWECWGCKTKGKITIKKGKVPQSLYEDQSFLSDWREQIMNDLREQAWDELVKEGLVRKEHNKYIWTHKGNVEIQKMWLKFEMGLHQKDNIRPKKF